MIRFVKDEMNKNVKTVSPDESVRDAAEKMAKYWMGSVVVTENDAVVGIMTERDIMKKVIVAGMDPRKTKVKDIMTKEVITIDENKNLSDAVGIMKAHDIKKLPVTRNGKLAGIITTTDIITAMDENIKEGMTGLDSYRDLKVLVRRHAIDLRREMEKNHVLTFLMPNSLYPADSMSIIKAVTEIAPKNVFVTLNKPYFSIMENLKAKAINTEGFFFIDASSQEGGEQEAGKEKGENFERVQSPSDLTDIMLAIGKHVGKGEYYSLIFDSLSTLLVYHSEEVVIRFAHSLVNKLRKYKVKGVFLCTKEDMNTSLMKNLNMLADYSVDIEKRGEIC
jgi:CBS domain-containing protein